MTTAKFQARALAYVTRNGFCTDRQLSRVTGCPIKAARRHLNALCKQGVAHRADIGRWVHGSIMAVKAGAKPVEVKPVVQVSDPWMLPRGFFQPTGNHA